MMQDDDDSPSGNKSKTDRNDGEESDRGNYDSDLFDSPLVREKQNIRDSLRNASTAVAARNRNPPEDADQRTATAQLVGNPSRT